MLYGKAYIYALKKMLCATTIHRKLFTPGHRRSQGDQRGHAPPTFLENIVILCIERRFSKQNSVIRLKSNILTPPKFLGWLRHCPWSSYKIC